MPSTTDPLREQLLAFLRGGNAHLSFAEAVAHFPPKLRGVVPAGLPYSAWQLVEHIRLAQADILHFSTNTDGSYVEPKWPDHYWPRDPAPHDAHTWDASVKAVEADRRAFEKIIADPKSDLFAAFPWGSGQNLLREALLIADHGAYHTGEIVAVRRLLNCWPAEK